jgi:cysteine sulfinate desulfinase/cysteine desulfurase-like protein
VSGVYLDYNASGLVRPEVQAAMVPFLLEQC